MTLAPLTSFIIQVTETRQVEVQVTADSLASALVTAKMRAARKGYETTKVNARSLAAWPADEAEEVVLGHAGGFETRRGWFLEVRLDYRSVCFLEADFADIDRSDVSAMVEKIEDLVEVGNDTIMGYERVYCWAGSHTSLRSWSKPRETSKAALRSVRRFVQEQRARTKVAA